MSNGYENAPATRMLATNCVICGRALVDAFSVERGIGPECYSHIQDGSVNIAPDIQKIANEHVYMAAIACQNGEVSKVLEYAEMIRELGLTTLADKVARRFRNANRNTEIVIMVEDGMLRVDTPFRRGAKEAFINAWRKIPGRKFKNGSNYVPVEQKKALFELLKEFFGGKFGKGPKGIFRIPNLDPVARQGELFQKVA
jgi:hypothetical protein